MNIYVEVIIDEIKYIFSTKNQQQNCKMTIKYIFSLSSHQCSNTKLASVH